tara:strand:- start:1287 stop:1571 length:285 start_codon:yes stop_codon:yes gene_type:complete
MRMAMNTLAIGALLVGLYVLVSDPPISKEEKVALCSQMSSDKVKDVDIPTINGHVDTRGMGESHPCYYEYFESTCKKLIKKETFNSCLVVMESH